MDTNEKIEYIEKELKEIEHEIDEIIDIVKSEVKNKVDCCFGIINTLVDWFFIW